ncbi:MAG TPA: hypothetical protein VMF08_11260 [Candidatus Sulfotelmatobacter sp.]|nr:hypothetical protein [Candidatus Sulfotelmatobacter sp.]
MKIILNSFRSLAGLTTALAAKFDPRKHHQTPFGRPGGKVPLEIAWSDENGFQVVIKVVRDGLRPRKSSKTRFTGWMGLCPAVLCPSR